jgi:hypothetical protein
MKVTLDASRILHLVALIGLSFIGAWFLVTFLDWTPMTAFGCTCTLVTQLSNLLLQCWSSVPLPPSPVGGKRNEETAKKKTQHLRKR